MNKLQLRKALLLNHIYKSASETPAHVIIANHFSAHNHCTIFQAKNTELSILKDKTGQLRVVVYAYNPSPGEEAQGQPGLFSETLFQNSSDSLAILTLD